MNNNLQIIIFGATGDLAFLKLFPALFELFWQKVLPEDFQIVGFARSEFQNENFRNKVKESLLQNIKKEDLVNRFIEHIYYHQGKYDDLNSFEKLKEFLTQLYPGEADKIAYFSVPPIVFADLISNLADTFQNEKENLKLVIEKPFGEDYQTAEKLFSLIESKFKNDNIFLLDHYLGKRPVQSLLKLRQENNVVNLMIKGSEIEKISIKALEKKDVDKRIGYYDQVGATKDMIQSHLIQILALAIMDIPINLDLNNLHREKENLISSLKFSGNIDDINIGQYQGYQDLEGVKENSNTETFAEIKLFIDKRDWFQVPIIFTTGKCLNEDKTEIIIEFKKLAYQNENITRNQLVFEMKPLEQISLKLIQKVNLKDKDQEVQYENIDLTQSIGCKTDFCLGDYANLIFNIIHGDKTYFLSQREVLEAWKLIDRIMEVIKKNNLKVQIYEKGSKGPSSSHI